MQVEEFQNLCIVQSDKATVDLPSKYSGTIVKLRHSPGDIVEVGASLLLMSVDVDLA